MPEQPALKTFGDVFLERMDAEVLRLGRKLTREEVRDVGNAVAHDMNIKKLRKKKAEMNPKPKPVRARDPLFDTLAEVCRMNVSELTRAGAAGIGQAKRDIVEVMPGVTPEEIRRRAQAFKAKHPTWDMTPRSLAKWWSTLGPGGAQTRTAKDDIYQEPVGDWRFTATQVYPGCDFSTVAWLDLGPDIRRKVLTAHNAK